MAKTPDFQDQDFENRVSKRIKPREL